MKGIFAMSLLKKLALVCVGAYLGCASVHALTEQTIKKNVESRFEKLSALFKERGADETFKRLNGHHDSIAVEHLDLKGFASGDEKSGGNIVCVVEGKTDVIVGNTDPTQVGKDVTNETPVKELIEALKKEESDKVTHHYTAEVKDGDKVVKHEMTAVAWGRKALLGADKAKSQSKKFMCYITFVNPTRQK